MPKYWNGISFEKKLVKDSKGREQEVVIAMSDDEYDDRSYRDYLETSVVEKTREEMEKKPVIERDPEKVRRIANYLKEVSEYKKRMKSEHPKKYF